MRWKGKWKKIIFGDVIFILSFLASFYSSRHAKSRILKEISVRRHSFNSRFTELYWGKIQCQIREKRQNHRKKKIDTYNVLIVMLQTNIVKIEDTKNWWSWLRRPELRTPNWFIQSSKFRGEKIEEEMFHHHHNNWWFSSIV